MRFKFKPLILLFILPLIVSCVDNADFNQIQVDLEPIVNTPLVYFELDQLDFLDDTGVTEVTLVSDVTDIDVFQTNIFRENLTRLDLFVNIQKDFPRGFRVKVIFLNDNLVPTYQLQDILFSSSSSELDSRQNIEIADNPDILNTTKMRVELELLGPSSNAVDPDVQWDLEFKSAGVFYLDF